MADAMKFSEFPDGRLFVLLNEAPVGDSWRKTTYRKNCNGANLSGKNAINKRSDEPVHIDPDEPVVAPTIAGGL